MKNRQSWTDRILEAGEEEFYDRLGEALEYYGDRLSDIAREAGHDDAPLFAAVLKIYAETFASAICDRSAARGIYDLVIANTGGIAYPKTGRPDE